MSKKAYEFRTLCSKDIFPMVTLINKIGIAKFKDAFQSDGIQKIISGGEKNLEAIGISVAFELAGIVLEALPKCEDDIYNMLSNVSNVKRKELEKMDMGTFFEMIVDFIQKPEFKDFMKVVSKLFK